MNSKRFQMIALLQMELATEAEDVLNSLEDEADSNHGDPLSLTDSNSPCLDILLSENIPAHILAASRMPVRDFIATVIHASPVIPISLSVKIRNYCLRNYAYR